MLLQSDTVVDFGPHGRAGCTTSILWAGIRDPSLMLTFRGWLSRETVGNHCALQRATLYKREVASSQVIVSHDAWNIPYAAMWRFSSLENLACSHPDDICSHVNKSATKN